ncbi:LysR family transcriptional regulator [Photobacterium sp. BZF1]|uniref:LysR family transcriptional regulator n=1 Tax=Photobacterium sp. BZF1 TaxID=1904457 RepID=UPI001653D117|nr:LysR family transcriptional regulator [Photobacterium sp. BZF1]MBC7004659.1 LysR family transcriptional regulator [Photobacterium sp. BZF1]
MHNAFEQLAALDLKMLRMLLVLIETKNLSRTAEILEIQQSTVSYQLGKLRDSLGDPLLIRCGRSLEPSPYAIQIQPALTAQLQSLENLLFESQFDPLKATGTLRIACHRNGARSFIHALISRMNKTLPQVRLDIVDWNERVPEMLREARLDFAIGFAPDNLSQVTALPLGKVNYQVVMANTHPLACTPLTESQLFDYPHIVVNTHEAVERWLNYLATKHHQHRNIAFSSSSMEFAAMALAGTDRLMFSAETKDPFFQQYDVTTHPAPFIPAQSLCLLFHERASLDPLRIYGKSLIEEAVSTVLKHAG